MHAVSRQHTRRVVRALSAIVVVVVLAGLGSPVLAGNTVGGIAQNAVIANGNGTAYTVFGTFLVASYVISGTFVATINFEGSGQDGSFQPLGCVPVISGAIVSSATTTGAWRCNIVGMIQIRGRVSGYTSGSVTVSIQASDTGTVLVGPATDTASSSILTNPTITGIVTGTPTWNSAQTFPGLRVNGGLGMNRAPPVTAGQYAATNAANSGTMVTLTRNTDTSPAGNFLDLQNAAAASLFTVDITGKATTYGGASATDGQLLIGGTTAANWTAATLTGTASQVTVTNGNNTITLSTPQNIATGSSPTFAGLTLSGLTAKSFLYSGTSGVLTTTAAPTNGQLLVGSTGAVPVAATLTGTTNQLSVTNGAGTITLALVGPYTPSTYTTNGVLYGAGTSSILATTQGPANSVLTANAGAPSFSATPTLTSLTLGSGTAITQITVYSQTLTPAQLAAAIGVSEQTFTVTGLTTADKILVNGPAPQALCPPITYRVSAADTLAIGFVDLTVALCTPTSGTYLVVAVRS